MKSKLFSLLLVFASIFLLIPGADASRAKKLASDIEKYISTHVTVTQQFPVYDKIRQRISDVISKIDRSQTEQRQLLKDLAFYHNNNILKLVAYITSRQGALDRFEEWKQEDIDTLLVQQKRYNTLDGKSVTYINTKDEITQNREIYKISYDGYQEVKNLGSMPEYNLFYKDTVGYIFISDFSVERKIPFSEIIQQGAKKFFVFSESFFVQENYLYTYAYDTFFTINSNYGVYKSEIERSGFSYEDALFLRLQDRKNNITFSPTQVPITSKSYFKTFDIEQQEFINTSVIDVLRDDQNYDGVYEDIINLAYKLTDGLENDEQKTRAIYDWMVQNIAYPKDYDIEDYKIFSGLEAYKNKSAVCEGQARLMYYLLKTTGVKDVEYISGYVVDADDFPQIGHAWIQVGDYFYDPSFEKPRKTSSGEDIYLYYKIPFDLAYINRYNSRDLPDALLTTGSANIKREIDRRVYNLSGRYDMSDGYELLREGYFKRKYNIVPDAVITLGDIIDAVDTYELYLKDGKATHTHPELLPEVSFFRVDNLSDTIDPILEELAYDLSGFAVLKRYEDNQFIGYGITDSLQD